MISKTKSLSKTDLRILGEKLEKYQVELSMQVRSLSRLDPRRLTKTRGANIERRIRIELQAVLLLKNLTQNRLENGYRKKTKRVTGFKQTVSATKRLIDEIKVTTI